MSLTIRLLAVTLGLIAVLYLAACLALLSFERTLIYRASRDMIEPAQAGLASTRVLDIPTQDGEHLVGWYRDAGAKKPLALYFHGNGGSLAGRADTIERLADFGFSVLAVDYRGFGGSTGSPSEAGLLEDAEASLRVAGSLGFEPSRIVAVGQSLGSGVATALAAHHVFGGLLLDSPFDSLSDVAADRYPLFPVRWLMRDTFRSDLRIGANRAPLMMLLGNSDEVVPIRYGLRLFSLAPSPKTMLRVDSGHMALNEPAVTGALGVWFKSLKLGL